MSSTAPAAAIVLALLQRRHPGTTPASVVERILAAGSISAAWELRERETLTAEADDEHLLASTIDELQEWSAMGIATHAFTESAYPQELLSVHDLPPVVWARGSLDPLDAAVSVVGTRAPSEWGRAFARAVAQGLAEAGITVVSGLAGGIDTEAHVGALEAGGRTVAVLGTGISHSYPRENAKLQERIAAEGLVLSQFRPEQGPTRWTFPQRNITMSGYSRASIVVEATEHSGTRIQGRVSLAHGRPVILSSTVVAKTAWAADLAGRPGVHVAESAAEAVEIAVAIAGARCTQLDRVLA